MLDITHHLIRLLSVSLIGVNGIVLARKLFHGQRVRPSRALAADKLSVRRSRGRICTASRVQLIFEDVNADCNERLKTGTRRPFRDPVLKRSTFSKQANYKTCCSSVLQGKLKKKRQDGVVPVRSGLLFLGHISVKRKTKQNKKKTHTHTACARHQMTYLPFFVLHSAV